MTQNSTSKMLVHSSLSLLSKSKGSKTVDLFSGNSGWWKGGMVTLLHFNENILRVSHSRLSIGQCHLEGENCGFKKNRFNSFI